MKRISILALAAALFGGLMAPSLGRPLAPIRLAVNDRVNPIGVGTARVLFSWLPQDSSLGELQTAYEIRVASSEQRLKSGRPDCWASGQVKSSLLAGIRYAGQPLASRQICYWQVRTWNSRSQASPWSAVARFELGLLSNEDWAASWIWADNMDESEDYLYFRKSFPLPAKAVARARAYVTASHRHELYVNGTLVGKGPNFAYPEHQYYQTFDLAPFLKPDSENVVGFLCHWYGSGQGRPYSRWGLLAKAVIDFSDGSSLVLATDGSWKLRPAEWDVPPGKISGRNFRNGEGIPAESIDGRRHPIGWNLPGYDDSDWQRAEEIGRHPTAPWTGPLIAQEPSIEEYEIRPVGVTQIGPGHFVADFGKVYAGMPRLRFRDGRPGQTVKIKVDYRRRADGTLQGHAQNTRLDYRYVLRGGIEEFRPYWYLGFRYVEVENAPAAFDPNSIRMIVRHNRVERDASSFECSNSILNQIWDLLKHSLMLGSHEQFVDTPTREQGQFTYDAYQISIGSMKCFGERLLSRQGLREFAQSQARLHQDTGKVNAVYPNGDGKRDIPDWTQSFLFWAWEYYLETGDRELLRELFDSLVKVGEYVKSTEDQTTGLVDLGNDPGYSGGITDWPERYGYDLKTSQRTIMSINACLDYLDLAQAARELGESEVGTRFEKYGADIRAAIESRLWDDSQQAYIDGLYADGTPSTHASQQANAMMLALGLAGEDRRAGAMAAVKRGGHSTGPILARYLVQAYGNADQDEALMEWLLNPKGRNFAYTLADGGTFTYEHWLGRNSRPDGRGASESHAYGANAGVVALQEYILGVKIRAPQAARLQIRPHVAGLAFARGHIPTQSGRVSVSWQSGRTFRMELTLPCNVRADVYVPRGEGQGTAVKVDGKARQGEAAGHYILLRDIGAGRHRFER
ncbi:MAG: family 78 glycoside hydrolase catalytic domain [Acidobacteriota bacterium]